MVGGGPFPRGVLSIDCQGPSVGKCVPGIHGEVKENLLQETRVEDNRPRVGRHLDDELDVLTQGPLEKRCNFLDDALDI